MKRKSRLKARFISAIFGVIIIVAGLTLYSYLLAPKQQIRSIAVLPFRDMSPDMDQDYFCEGIAEEILNSLTNVSNLSVLASTSSFTFKGKDTDIGEIGRQLNVEAVLEGGVRKFGDDLRITAQQIMISDQSHFFSLVYGRKKWLKFFTVEKEISLAYIALFNF